MYSTGNLSITPASLTISAGFQRLFTLSGKDNSGATFQVVPESFSLSSQLGTITDQGAGGVLFTAQKTGSVSLSAGFGTESAVSSITVTTGDLASIRILDTNGLPFPSSDPLRLSEATLYYFDVVGFDSYGNKIAVNPAWSADVQIGTINQNARLDTTGCAGSGNVTASLDWLTDTKAVEVLSRAKEITSFSINGINATVSAPFISITLPWGTDLSSLTAQFSSTGKRVEVNGVVQTSGVTANNFSGPLVYTVYAEDESVAYYTVNITMLKPFKEITAYSINGVPGTINGSNITLTLDSGLSVTALVAAFNTTGSFVSVNSMIQISGVTPNDFTNPVTYTVTAEDGTTQDYTVTLIRGSIWGSAIWGQSKWNP